MSARSKRLAIVAGITLILAPMAYFLIREFPISRALADPESAIVDYFRQNGINMENDKQLSHWWIVTKPSGGDFRVAVAFHAFPPSATAEQMQNELMVINLAFRLNAPAHIAMSYPSKRGTNPVSHTQDPIDDDTSKRMLELFDRYSIRARW